MIEPSKKMAAFGPSIFTHLKAYAMKKKQQGETLIDLSVGSPDLPPDKRVRSVLADESAKAGAYGYTLGGTDLFYEAVARYYKRRSHVTLDPKTQVVQTMGSQEGLVHLPLAFCNPGDIVLTTNPAYVAYEAGVSLAGAVPYYMPLLPENQFLPDLSIIPDDVAKRAKLLLLNLPGNPIPAMPDRAFFERVIAFAQKHEILVLHDAAYSEFYFQGGEPFSFLAIPGAMDIGIEVNSLSKSFSLAGARVAYMAGNAGVIDVMKQLKSNLDYGVFQPVQAAAAFALDHAEEITDKLREEFKARAEALSSALQEIGWPVEQPGGGMFLWARIPNGDDDRAFVLRAIDESGVVMVPGSAFGTAGKGYVRIALVQPVPVLKQAAVQLKKVMA